MTGEFKLNAVVWSKNNCPYCEQAKSLLKLKGIQYEERNINSGNWTKEQLLEAVPSAKSVPQIFLDEEHVGGYQELVRRLK